MEGGMEGGGQRTAARDGGVSTVIALPHGFLSLPC